MGLNYTGTVSKTILGDQCQPWIDQHPHQYNTGTHNHEFPENNVTQANNYCRNVDNDEHGPWCYTMNPELESLLTNLKGSLSNASPETGESFFIYLYWAQSINFKSNNNLDKVKKNSYFFVKPSHTHSQKKHA